MPAAVEIVTVPEEVTGSTPEAPPEATSRRRRRTTRKTETPRPATTAGARLVTRRGMVELQINGQPVPPVLFFGNVEGEREARHVASEVKRAAAAGVHIHSTLVEIPCPLSPDDTVYEMLDTRLQTLLDADPAGWVMPRVVFIPAPGWMRQYPNEVAHYADGRTADPSIASYRFWQDAEHALRSIIEHVQRTTYGERVLGYHLERGEWFHPADNGYDRSFANREAFREWLKAKYKNSVVALRAGWYDGDVQFHTAEIPPMPATPRPETTFFEPRKERRWIDFLDYTSDIPAERLISLSKVVKEASDGRALVSVCYGYTFEFEHTFSGHLALGKVLTAPTIDIIAGPPSYKDRQPGQPGSFPSPVDAMAVHGKLWVSEDDTKTHLAPAEPTPDDFNLRLDNNLATEQVHLRAIGTALAHQTGIAWMDLWGEGWLDAEDIWQRIGTMQSRYGDLMKGRRAESPDVAVLVGERSLLHVQRGATFVKRLLQGNREALQRCGASVGYYLQSDVTARAFPTDAKVYIFLCPYRLPPDQRAAIKEKLQRGERTLVWLYAIGVCDERGQPEESANDVVGMTLRAQSWSSEIGSRLADSRHPIIDKAHQREVGIRERLNPSYYVDDDAPGVTVLGTYLQSGLPSIAVREHEGWRSVFCGETVLTTDLVRGICQQAGVHLYTAMGDDYVSAGHGCLVTHTPRDGQRTLVLPPRCGLYDLIGDRLLGEDLSEYRAFVRGRTTRLFYVGTVDEMHKLGLPGVERPRGRRRGQAAAAAGAEVAQLDGAGAVLIEEPDQDIVLEAAAVEGAPDGEESAAAAAGEGTPDEEAARRRRRRRGGRGRGRRRRAPGAESGVAAPAEGGPAED